jgi:hypothetical protein
MGKTKQVSQVSANKSFEVHDSDFKTSTKTSPFIDCVQVAIKPQGVALRDSKDPGRKTLFFNQREWEAFVQGVKDGEFDLGS